MDSCQLDLMPLLSLFYSGCFILSKIFFSGTLAGGLNFIIGLILFVHDEAEYKISFI